MQTEQQIARSDKDDAAHRQPPELVPTQQAALSPLVDRLGTPEGRARALKALDASTEGDEDEQRETAALLARAAQESPLAMREATRPEAERAA